MCLAEQVRSLGAILDFSMSLVSTQNNHKTSHFTFQLSFTFVHFSLGTIITPVGATIYFCPLFICYTEKSFYGANPSVTHSCLKSFWTFCSQDKCPSPGTGLCGRTWLGSVSHSLTAYCSPLPALVHLAFQLFCLMSLFASDFALTLLCVQHA